MIPIMQILSISQYLLKNLGCKTPQVKIELEFMITPIMLGYQYQYASNTSLMYNNFCNK